MVLILASLGIYLDEEVVPPLSQDAGKNKVVRRGKYLWPNSGALNDQQTDEDEMVEGGFPKSQRSCWDTICCGKKR